VISVQRSAQTLSSDFKQYSAPWYVHIFVIFVSKQIGNMFVTMIITMLEPIMFVICWKWPNLYSVKL